MITIEQMRRVIDMILEGMIADLTRSVSAGKKPDANVLAPVGELFGFCYEMGHPDAELVEDDLTEDARQLPDSAAFTQQPVTLVYVHRGEDLIFLLVQGQAEPGTSHDKETPASKNFDAALTRMVTNIMLNRGFSAEAVSRLTNGNGQRLGSFSPLNDATLDKHTKERIDAEVEEFRDQLNANLDSMFGGGDES